MILLRWKQKLTICSHDAGNHNSEGPFKADSKDDKSNDDIEEGRNYVEQNKLQEGLGLQWA